MGSEFGQWREWDHDHSLDWHLLDDPAHAGLRRYVQALNWHFRNEPSLHEIDLSLPVFAGSIATTAMPALSRSSGWRARRPTS
jgi:1,4-alpha-glucan branching enzyme